MSHLTFKRRAASMAAAVACTLGFAATQASAVPVLVTVTVKNFSPATSVAVAPLHFGFNNGTFDAFNLGGVANAAIISVAEGGSGSAWQPAFALADPTATRGTVGGLRLAGTTASLTVMVDATLNPFFTDRKSVV